MLFGNMDGDTVYGWNTADKVVGRLLYGEDYQGPEAPVAEFGTTQIPLRSMVEVAEAIPVPADRTIDVAAQIAADAVVAE